MVRNQSHCQKCPYCISYQSRHRICLSLSLSSSWEGLESINVFSGHHHFVKKDLCPRNLFKGSRHAIFICRFEGIQPFVVTIGKITNRSKIAWSSLNIEVTYFDQQGSLIDVLNEDLYPIVVPPQGEATFKVGGLAAASRRSMFDKRSS